MWQEQVNNWQLISRDKQFESVDAEVFGPSGLLPHMDEEASAHTPRNQHHLPIGKGNGGQTPKGHGKGGKRK